CEDNFNSYLCKPKRRKGKAGRKGPARRVEGKWLRPGFILKKIFAGRRFCVIFAARPEGAGQTGGLKLSQRAPPGAPGSSLKYCRKKIYDGTCRMLENIWRRYGTRMV